MAKTLKAGEIKVTRVIGPPPPRKGFSLVATARNELFFWPHFVSHYRQLGVNHFVVLDDHSTDGSLEWLSEQPDVTVFTSKFGFADTVGTLRFGIIARQLLAKSFCTNRWALIADLDEFWLPPPQFPSFPSLAQALDAEDHLLCRGLMLDCFPEKLSNPEMAVWLSPPDKIAPYTDNVGPIVWPAHKTTATLANEQNVRNRMANALMHKGILTKADLAARGIPTMYKAPLAKWVQQVSMVSAHRLNAPYHDQHQIVCAHYKFYPGWTDKVKGAIQTGSYYKGSVEYQMMAHAAAHLSHTTLLGPKSLKFSDLVSDSTLLY